MEFLCFPHIYFITKDQIYPKHDFEILSKLFIGLTYEKHCHNNNIKTLYFEIIKYLTDFDY